MSFVIDRTGVTADEPAAWNKPIENVEEKEEDNPSVENASAENALAENASVESGSEDSGEEGGSVEGSLAEEDVSNEGARKRPRSKAPVWVDDDDGAGEVNLVERRSKRKFRKKMGEKRVDTAEYEQRIREFYHQKVVGSSLGAADWARRPSELAAMERSDSDSDSDSGSDSDDDLGQRVARLFQASGQMNVGKRDSKKAIAVAVHKELRAGVIKMKRMTNLNKESPNRAITHCIDFHPTGRLALTAGLDRAVRVFQVDGRENARVQGVVLRDLQIASARFTGGGTGIVAAGAQWHVYRIDLASGQVVRHRGFGRSQWKSKVATKQVNDVRNGFAVSASGEKLAFMSDTGRVNIVQESTMQSTGTLHLPGQMVGVAFDPDNDNRIYTLTEDAKVHLWDARMYGCVDRHRDEGAVHGTALAVGRGLYAVGSDTGIVNVYDKSQLGESMCSSTSEKLRTEKPKKAISNLTTAVNHLTFNNDGRLLSISSRRIKDAAKMVHVPTLSVYSNWPVQSSLLGYVQTAAFSPGGGWFSIGNDKGDAHLFRLPAFPAN